MSQDRFQVVLAQPAVDSLAHLARLPLSPEQWIDLARQLGELLLYLSEQPCGVLPISSKNLTVHGGRLHLVDRGWQQAIDSSVDADLHYLQAFRALMGELLNGSQASSDSSLLWLFNRRYGNLQELVACLRETQEDGDSGSLVQVPNFVVPNIKPEIGIFQRFVGQPPAHLALELLLLVLACLAGAAFYLRPPARLPENRLYLRTDQRLLVFDTQRERVATRWSLDQAARVAVWRNNPVILVNDGESSEIASVSLELRRVLDKMVLPTTFPPSRLAASGDGFVAVAPGTVVLGEVHPTLQAKHALPAGRDCLAFLSAGHDVFLADQTMLRRFDSRSGRLQAETALSGITDLALAGPDLVATRTGFALLTLLDPVTLKSRRTLDTAGQEPLRLLPGRYPSGAFLSSEGRLLMVDFNSGQILARETLQPLTSGLWEGEKLWLLSQQGELLVTTASGPEVRPVPLKEVLRAICIP